MDSWIIITEILVLLAGCLLVGGALSRLGQSPIVGYLLAGMILGGPGSLNLVSSQSTIHTVSELGVALLLFSLGLEFSLERLKKLGARPLIGGVVQITLTVLVGYLVAGFFGLGTKEAVGLGVMIALSSTAVVLRILVESGELDSPHGRNCLGVLLTQDMAVVPLAILMTVLGASGEQSDILSNILQLSVAIVGLVVGLYLVTKIAVLFLGSLTLNRNRELSVVFAIVVGLGAAVASHAAGISPALGSFVAGMMLGSSQFATQIRADVSPLRVVLLTLFFGAAGMVADPMWIIENWLLVGATVLAITAGKFLIIWGIFAALGQSVRVASASGLCIAQIGEFAFVLGSIGLANGVVSEELYALVVSATIISFILTAFLVPMAGNLGDRLAKILKSGQEAELYSSSSEEPPDVVIIGFGPAAQEASAPLVDSELSVLVIDLNRDGVNRAKKLGFRAEIGDARQQEVLEHSNINKSRFVLITVPHHRSTLKILSLVRHHAPQAHVIIRSRYTLNEAELESAGAHFVAGDEHEVGRTMARTLKGWLEQGNASQANC